MNWAGAKQMTRDISSKTEEKQLKR